MKTVWDYTTLANSYKSRAEYSQKALKKMIDMMKLKAGDAICDVGAGLGHLAIPLAGFGFNVCAVEPNDEMRRNGMERSKAIPKISWVEATAENTTQKDSSFHAVTFGSSFNVCDKAKALTEANRIVKSGGWFACMWNHRDLEDPIQKQIENIIKKYIPDYNYGDRRADQTEILNQSPLLKSVEQISDRFMIEQSIDVTIEAWFSHGTLERQAKGQFNQIVEEIAAFLRSLNTDKIKIPYFTKIWVAQFKK